MASSIAVWRQGAGFPLVMIHGDFSTGRDAWQRQMSTIADRDLIVVDRRGYGASPADRDAYTIEGDAADVMDGLQGLGVDRFDLVGHSYGGLVANALALQAGDRVRSLMLIEPPLMAALPDNPDVRSLVEKVEAIREAAKTAPHLTTARAFITMLAGEDALPRVEERPEWPTLVASAPRFARSQPPGAYDPGVFTRLRADLPVSVLTGGRSQPGLQAIPREIHRLLPGSELVAVPRAGHAVQYAEPEFSAAFAALMQQATGEPVAPRS